MILWSGMHLCMLSQTGLWIRCWARGCLEIRGCRRDPLYFQAAPPLAPRRIHKVWHTSVHHDFVTFIIAMYICLFLVCCLFPLWYVPSQTWFYRKIFGAMPPNPPYRGASSTEWQALKAGKLSGIWGGVSPTQLTRGSEEHRHRE